MASSVTDGGPTAFDQFQRKSADEALVQRLMRYVGERDGGDLNVLEIGCGCGNEVKRLRELRPEAKFVALDKVEGVRQGFADAKGTLDALSREGIQGVGHSLPDKLPFEDSQFALVFARLSLHYFPEAVIRERILPELKRVMKPEAALVFVIKTRENLGAFGSQFGDEKVILTTECWSQMLEDYGFQVEVSEASLPASTDEDADKWHAAGAPWAFEVLCKK